MRRRRWQIGLLVGLAAMASSLCVASAGAAVRSPHIKAHPNNAMVNTSISLAGTKFPAKSTFTIEECSQTSWIAGQSPCSTNNAVSVTTNARGHFQTLFKVEVGNNCQRGSEPTSVICYVGEPKPTGIDTVGLTGAARITVTYP